jgi:hypothetical protein
MSASGKSVKNGDVYLDEDGYIRVLVSNTSDVWFTYLVSNRDTGAVAWVSEPKAKAYIPDKSKYVMNIKDMLVSVREELLSEPST